MPVDPNIPLSINPSAISGPDLGKMLSLADMAQEMQVKRVALAKQNALAQLMSNPQSFAPDGTFTPQAVQAISGVDANAGMKIREMTIEEKAKQLQEAHYKTEAGKAKFDYLAGVAGMASDAYDEAKKAGRSDQEATSIALAARNEALKENGGILSDNDEARVSATPFNPEQAKIFAKFNPSYAKRQSEGAKEDIAQRRETELERHNRESEERMTKAIMARTEALEEKPGQQETIKVKGKDGSINEVQAFVKGPGKVVDIAGNPIDPSSIVGASKTGVSGKGGAAEFTPKMGEMMAALAEKGVALPTGFRSKEQQAALYAGILERNPDKSPDQIADMIKKGEIEFGAQRKETTTAAGIAGKVQVFANELDKNLPLVRQAASKVPRGEWTDLNRLIQTKDSHISNPELKSLKGYITSTLNAYDALAARGGTDKDKREENRKTLLASDGPEAFEAQLKVFENEAKIAKEAAFEATKSPELPGDEEEKKPSNPTLPKGWSVKVQ